MNRRDNRRGKKEREAAEFGWYRTVLRMNSGADLVFLGPNIDAEQTEGRLCLILTVAAA